MQTTPAHLYLSKEDRKSLLKKNNWKASYEIVLHWLWITFAFALVHFFPNPITIIISLFILGGKQLACAILMHDAGHRAVFNNKKWNDLIGQWLGAYPIWHNMHSYREYHYRHHVHTGLPEDPDLLLTRGYPTSSKSMMRKFGRDLSGITGIKAFFGLTLMHLGYLQYNLGGKIERHSSPPKNIITFGQRFMYHLSGPLFVNLLLFSILYLIGNPFLYLLWIIAYLTTFQFSLRVRSIAEHSLVKDCTDPFQNTRTTKANTIEKILFAPYHVNYHAEHHMLMAVPSYNLPHMHQLLLKKGFYEKGILSHGYWSIIKAAAQGQKKGKD
ncbi:fatty acid desaturase family protein [Algivirga pacifica]|uniref:Fatty acid desaturase family protein n=1 Tax=Algivirga pacifica TaxID=1162670 RepID=A0ABP9CZW9_9BACT